MEQYATTPDGHRVSTAVTRQFKRQQHFRRDYLALSLEFYFVTPLQRDLDNSLKIIQDTLCKYLGVNDNRVVDIHLSKRIDPLHPHLDIELEALENWQFDIEYILGHTVILVLTKGC